MNDTSNSIFWKEIFEQPEAVANCLAANREVCKQIAAEVKERNIKTVVLVGRGSSDHANLVGRYLFEAKCGMVTSISAPSVVVLSTGFLHPADIEFRRFHPREIALNR